jgi:hypothetical protein
MSSSIIWYFFCKKVTYDPRFLTKNLFKIHLSFNILLRLKELKHREIFCDTF